MTNDGRGMGGQPANRNKNNQKRRLASYSRPGRGPALRFPFNRIHFRKEHISPPIKLHKSVNMFGNKTFYARISDTRSAAERPGSTCAGGKDYGS